MSPKPSPLNVHFSSTPVHKSKSYSDTLPSPADTIASGFSSVMSYGGYSPPSSATAGTTPSIRPVVHDSPSYSLPTPSTQFCRALHPYSDLDTAILSIERGDVIEILSQHPSGWWDCLVGDTWNGYGLGGTVRRGWVPSNYVRVLGSREEAKAFVQSAKMDAKKS